MEWSPLLNRQVGEIMALFPKCIGGSFILISSIQEWNVTMGSEPFFALLRSFAELSPMQLERAQEHIHDHQQRNLLHQALAEQQAVPQTQVG